MKSFPELINLDMSSICDSNNSQKSTEKNLDFADNLISNQKDKEFEQEDEDSFSINDSFMQNEIINEQYKNELLFTEEKLDEEKQIMPDKNLKSKSAIFSDKVFVTPEDDDDQNPFNIFQTERYDLPSSKQKEKEDQDLMNKKRREELDKNRQAFYPKFKNNQFRDVQDKASDDNIIELLEATKGVFEVKEEITKIDNMLLTLNLNDEEKKQMKSLYLKNLLNSQKSINSAYSKDNTNQAKNELLIEPIKSTNNNINFNTSSNNVSTIKQFSPIGNLPFSNEVKTLNPKFNTEVKNLIDYRNFGNYNILTFQNNQSNPTNFSLGSASTDKKPIVGSSFNVSNFNQSNENNSTNYATNLISNNTIPYKDSNYLPYKGVSMLNQHPYNFNSDLNLFKLNQNNLLNNNNINQQPFLTNMNMTMNNQSWTPNNFPILSNQPSNFKLSSNNKFMNPSISNISNINNSFNNKNYNNVNSNLNVSDNFYNPMLLGNLNKSNNLNRINPITQHNSSMTAFQSKIPYPYTSDQLISNSNKNVFQDNGNEVNRFNSNDSNLLNNKLRLANSISLNNTPNNLSLFKNPTNKNNILNTDNNNNSNSNIIPMNLNQQSKYMSSSQISNNQQLYMQANNNFGSQFIKPIPESNSVINTMTTFKRPVSSNNMKNIKEEENKPLKNEPQSKSNQKMHEKFSLEFQESSFDENYYLYDLKPEEITVVKLKEIPNLIEFVNTKRGSKTLQNFVLNLPKNDIKELFDMILPVYPKICINQYGNFFMTKFIDFFNSKQRKKLWKVTKINLLEICTNEFGNHCVQALIANLNSPEEEIYINNLLCPFYTVLSLNKFGTFVIQKILLKFSLENRSAIHRFTVDNFMTLVTNIHGVCVIKKYILANKYAPDSFKKTFVDTFHKFFMEIVNDPCGNYSVFCLLEEWGINIMLKLVKVLESNVSDLGVKKYSQSLILKCLTYGDEVS